MKKESSLCWEGPSDIILYINGVKQSVSGKQVILPVGRSSLLFEVTTDDSLPCIILKGAGLENLDEWQVSMDKEHWTIPRVPSCIINRACCRSSARYDSPD